MPVLSYAIVYYIVVQRERVYNVPRLSRSELLKVVTDLAAQSMFGTMDSGICTSCHYIQDGVEPDAEGYTCEECDKPTVIGAENALMMLV